MQSTGFVKCGNCKASHMEVQDVKDCYQAEHDAEYYAEQAAEELAAENAWLRAAEAPRLDEPLYGEWHHGWSL